MKSNFRCAVFALFLSACSADRVPTGVRISDVTRLRASNQLQSVLAQNTRAGIFLPYGVAIPEGSMLDRVPEPFDPARHRTNRAAVPGIGGSSNRAFPARPSWAYRQPLAPSGGTDAHAGIFLDAYTRGIDGLMDVRADVNVPNGWNDAFVYAPTLLPGGGACMEVSTIHWKGAYWGKPDDVIGIWDWCHNNTFVQFWSFTSAFKTNYVRNYYDEWGNIREKYYVVIIADHPGYAPGSSDNWTVLFYNFYTGNYDVMWQISGTGFSSYSGWSMHESYHMQGYYNNGACISLPSIRTIAMNVRMSNGVWTPPTSSVRMSAGWQDGNCWANGSYTLYIDQYTDGDWWAWTPSNSQ